MDQILFAFYLLLTIPIGIVLGRFLHRSAPKAIKRLRKPHNWKKIVGITLGCLVALMLLDVVTPAFGGQLRFYAKWIECGHLPLQQPMSWGPQYVKYYAQSPAFAFLRSNHTEYFCSPKEAEMQWYSSNADSYSYPNLTAKDIELREKNQANN